MRPIQILAFLVLLIFVSCDKEPRANFSVQLPANVGDTLIFINSSENSNRFFWDFGDGNTSEEASPQHAYEKPGTYRVELTAGGEKGSSTSSVNLLVTGVSYSFTNNTSLGLVNFSSFHWNGNEIVALVEHGNLFPSNTTEVVISDYLSVDFIFNYEGDIYISANSYSLSLNQHNELIIDEDTELLIGESPSAARELRAIDSEGSNKRTLVRELLHGSSIIE